MKRPIVSIIVPVYNVQDYLEPCLKSILVQTFTDFELILVDDGSSDSSGVICDDYALKDGRIKVYHQQNAGVSAARNKGIDNAVGKYILFIDSDDYVDEGYIQSFIDIQHDNEADWIIEGYKDGPDVPNAIVCRPYYEQLFSRFHITSRKGCYPKLYLREVLDVFDVKFEVGIGIGEDFLFNLNYLLFTNKVVMENKKLYNRVARRDSLSRSSRHPREGLLALNVFLSTAEKVVRELNLKGEATKSLYKESLLYIETLLNSIHNLPSRYERIECLNKIDLSFYDQYKKPSSFKERILVTCIRYRWFRIYDALCHLARIFK